ncbi:hypothetical protein [Thiomicrorhabdus sp.]|uniref:hypothetical protein n=1 Tax=Thiomicrorhabdus sp. TaxID=2039724 RepID=UPI0029C85FF4|nr:hypothetical protein [Thiomicrorhabdus sp.]
MRTTIISSFFHVRNQSAANRHGLPVTRWLLVFWLFLFTQFSGTIHAEIHPFHGHSEFCGAFEQMVDPRIDTPFFRLRVLSEKVVHFKPVFYVFCVYFIVARNYPVRAPPSLSGCK